MADMAWLRPSAVLKKPAPPQPAPRPWSSVTPTVFRVSVAFERRDYEAAVNSDAMLALQSDRYAQARANYLSELRKPALHRRALDLAVGDVMVNYGAAMSRVGLIAIEILKRDLEQLQDARDRALEQRDSAIDQLRELRQAAVLAAQATPPEIKLSLDSLPDINVTVKPSAGISLDYDEHGKVIGTRPRGPSPTTKALKQTQAGKSIDREPELTDVIDAPGAM